MKRSGFTLVELAFVIAIIGILAATLAVFLPPALKGYSDARRRAELTDTADTALRQIAHDIRRAVPNSVRVQPVNGKNVCLQLVPTIGGGRYRMADDPTPGSDSRALDTTTEVEEFDVLTPLPNPPAKDDWVVIDNQNGEDVYEGSNRQQVESVDTPAAPNGVYLRRIKLKAAHQFPPGYEGGRFLVVADDEQSVFYSCDLASGGLYRVRKNFDADPATSCGTAASAGALVASDVENCEFTYETGGATQQSALVWMKLQFMRDGERVTLGLGTHVENVP